MKVDDENNSVRDLTEAHDWNPTIDTVSMRPDGTISITSHFPSGVCLRPEELETLLDEISRVRTPRPIDLTGWQFTPDENPMRFKIGTRKPIERVMEEEE